MTERPQHPFDAYGTVCPVEGCSAPRRSIAAMKVIDKNSARWGTSRRVRLECECANGHRYVLKIRRNTLGRTTYTVTPLGEEGGRR